LQWASEQMIKFWWQSRSQVWIWIWIRIATLLTLCLGGGMHCPSASSLLCFLCSLALHITLFYYTLFLTLS